MSEGGGTGISTLLVLQPLARARAVWGDHQARAIWDSAIVKVILGGGSNAALGPPHRPDAGEQSRT